MGRTRAWWMACLVLAGCNGSGITAVIVTANRATLAPGQSAVLTASVIGTGSFSSAVTWTLEAGAAGSLTFTGNTANYTAPLVGAPTSVTIRATSTENTAQSGTATLSISTALGIQVAAVPDQLYGGNASTLTATPGSGIPGLVWSIESAGPGTLSAPSGNQVVYLAPTSVPTQRVVVVRASSSADPLVYGNASITLHPVTVVINPEALRLFSTQTIALNGTVNGPPGVDPGVTWSIQGGSGPGGNGTLSATSGTDISFTAPAVSTEQTVVIRATPVADPGQHTDLTLIVDHGWPAVVESTASSSSAPQDVARGVAVDYDSFAVYVAGETSGQFDIAQQGQGDGFVAKFDRYGNQSWVRQFGTEALETVTGVVADLSGNVFVGGLTLGRTWAPDPPAGAPAGGAIGFLIAYDKDGNFLWRKDFGPVAGADHCGVHGLAMDQNQYVHAAGNCVQPLGFVQQCTATGCDGANTRLTLVGPTTALPFPLFQGVAVDAFGNYDLVGSTEGGGGVQSGFVAQVAPANCPAGSLCPPTWVAPIVTDAPAQAVSLGAVVTDGSNVYVGGTTSGAIDGQPVTGGTDALLAMYDRTGAQGVGVQEWLQIFGTGADEQLSGLAIDTLFGECVPTGTIDRGAGDEDVFLSFYDLQGGEASPQVTFEAGTSTDQGGGVAVADGEGNLILGFTTGAQLSGPPVMGLHVGLRKVDPSGNPLSL